VAADLCDALWPDPQRRISLAELAELSGLTPTEVVEFVEYGAFAPAEGTASSWVFTVREVFVARTARRLGEEFALEPHAVALMLAYQDRIRALEEELRALRASGIGRG